jgi:hypothetical protein
MPLITLRNACILLLTFLPIDSVFARTAVSGGAGTTMESAFVISAVSSAEGLMIEYSVIRERFPDWEINSQSLKREGSRYFDMFTLSKDGKTTKVWFDITSCFGK